MWGAAHMPDWPTLLGGYASVAIAASICVWVTLRALQKRQILDFPNARSSHSKPVPRGAGLGVLATLIPVWLGITFVADPTRNWVIPTLAIGIGAVSWIDDLRGLPTVSRFIAQAAAVGLGISLLPGPLLHGAVAPVIDYAVTGLIWLWFLNLFNFMDGIDGITGVSALAMGIGVSLVLSFGTLDTAGALHALSIAAVALGFLVWNWHPARIFLGDVGSIPLGFLIGWLLLTVAASEHWPAALIIPLYYLADSGLTLVNRLARGANITRPHREHFYQRAVARGRSHAVVSAMVLATSLALTAHAVVVTLVGPAATLPALASAAALVSGLLVWMRLHTRSPSSS